jgi:HEAT repeat protein
MARHLFLTLGITFFFAGGSLPAQDKASFLGKTADGWAAQLKSADAALRRQAAFALGKMSTRAIPALKDMKLALKNEKETRVRETLLYALGEICRDTTATSDDAELEMLFVSALTDDADAQVRRSAVFALGCLAMKSDTTRKALELALSDAEAIVRQNAAWALGQLGDAVLPLLQKALRDGDSFVKRDAASALIQLKDADEVHKLLKDLLPLCNDANSEVRRAALNVLVRIVDAKDKEAIAPLKAALADRDLENKRNAALALSNIGGDESAAALPILLEAIRNGDKEQDKELRRQAVAAIRNIGPAAAKAINDLTAILRDDTDEEMRRNAALALGGLGKSAEAAIPLLVRKIQDAKEDHVTRFNSANALRFIGAVPTATQVVPDLLAFMTDRDQNPEIRLVASWALRVHRGNLRNMAGAMDAYKKLTKEPLAADNKMLRYDGAYILGCVWQQDAPDEALDLLGVFLHDAEFKIVGKTTSGVGGASTETGSGKVSVKVNLKGDARLMAVEALEFIGARRYAQRADIMKQLRVLAADKSLYEPLQKKAAELVKAAK